MAMNEWGSGTATQLRHISKWRPAGISVIKTNHLAWIIHRELSNFSCWCRHKLRKTLIWDWYCWTAEVPFKILFKSLVRGCQVGVVVISRTVHLYDLGSSPGLPTWAEIGRSQSDVEGFSPGTLVFSPFCKFDFHAKTWAVEWFSISLWLERMGNHALLCNCR